MLVGIEYGDPGGFEVIVIAEGDRIQFDLAPDDHTVARRMVALRVLKVERAGLRGHLERHAERCATRFPDRASTGAVVGAGEVEPSARDPVNGWLPTPTLIVASPILLFSPAQPFIGLWFGAQFDTRQHTGEARR